MMRFLAHAGGWDELAYFAVPAVVAILAVRWAEKRAKRRFEQEKADAADSPNDEPAS